MRIGGEFILHHAINISIADTEAGSPMMQSTTDLLAL